MTLRGLFYTTGGTLRALWRVAAFIVVFLFFDWSYTALSRAVPRPDSFIGGQLYGFSIVLAAAATAQFILLRAIEKRPWSEIGLGAAQAAPRLLRAGLALGALGILVPSLFLVAVHWLAPADPIDATGGSLLFAGKVAVLFLPQSLAEEIISRGYGFAAIREGAGAIAAVAVTSLIFGALHLGNPGASAQSVSSVVLAGVFLGMIVVVTGSVYAAWMAHFAWNFTLVGLLHAKVSGVSFAVPGWRLIESGPAWATGGAWGPEGGAAAWAGMLAIIGALLWWQRTAIASKPLELSHG